MLRAAVLLLVPAACLLAGAAAPPAPPNEGARSDMMALYDAVCLDRFPNMASVQAAAAEQHFPAASQAVADRALHGRTGQAWQAHLPHGSFVLAAWTAPKPGCAVTGAIPEDATTRAEFDVMITMFAGEHEVTKLAKRPLGHGTLAGQPADLQVITGTRGGYGAEGFFNVALTNADGTPEARLANELANAPPAPPAPPAPHPAPNPPAKP
jgi:hypothetical protein